MHERRAPGAPRCERSGPGLIPVGEHSAIAGLSIAQANLRPRAGVSIVAVSHDGLMTSTPQPDIVLGRGDDIAVIGSASQIDAARRLIAG